MNILQDGENILQYIGLSRENLQKLRATKTICMQKVVVYYYLNQICGYTLEETGMYCYKDHSTIKQQIKKYNNKLEGINEELLQLYNKTNNKSTVNQFIMS